MFSYLAHRRHRPSATATTPTLRYACHATFFVNKAPLRRPEPFAMFFPYPQKKPNITLVLQRDTTANRVAVLLHKCCTALAVLLHGLCSTAAQAMQHCCKGCAVKLQRLCSKRAEAMQENRQSRCPRPWTNRPRPGKAEMTRMTGKEAGVCPLTSGHASELSIPFLPPKNRCPLPLRQAPKKECQPAPLPLAVCLPTPSAWEDLRPSEYARTEQTKSRCARTQR